MLEDKELLADLFSNERISGFRARASGRVATQEVVGT